MTSLRIATLDIETFPIEAYVWDLWDQNVGLNQIIKEWSIASFCWKWFNEEDPSKGEVIYMDTRGKNPRNDSKLLVELHKLLDSVDVVIAQNGKAFDVKKINGRLLECGYKPPSPYRVIDTMLEAKAVAKFSSNKLAWLSEHLTDTPKSEHKKFPGFELWSACLKNDLEAWEEMREYNIIDVEATEKVYLKLRGWIKNHPTVKIPKEADGRPACNRCGSTSLQRRGTLITNNGTKTRYQCNSCGGWLSAKAFDTPAVVRKELLVSK